MDGTSIFRRWGPRIIWRSYGDFPDFFGGQVIVSHQRRFSVSGFQHLIDFLCSHKPYPRWRLGRMTSKVDAGTLATLKRRRASASSSLPPMSQNSACIAARMQPRAHRTESKTEIDQADAEDVEPSPRVCEKEYPSGGTALPCGCARGTCSHVSWSVRCWST